MRPLSRRRLLGLLAVNTASALGLGTIATPSAAAASRRDFSPAVVVGTGYGAAVTALRLGLAGIPTVMLEMGRLWDTPGDDGRVFCDMLNPDRRAMWLATRTQMPLSSFLWLDIDRRIERFTGVLDCVHHGDISVYVGRGVEVVRSSTVRWRSAEASDVRQAFPDVDSDGMYRTYFPVRGDAGCQPHRSRVVRDLRVVPLRACVPSPCAQRGSDHDVRAQRLRLRSDAA